MSRTSAGILLYRLGTEGLEVLLVHPGGPFWDHKDLGSWSVPKGEVADGEDLVTAARRELYEETGFRAEGPPLPLGHRRQPGGKVVHVWAVAGDADPTHLRSNTFRMEWPPGSGRLQEFPEVDRAAWLTLPVARQRILPGQVDFLDTLVTHLGTGR